jgi:hypothetical protein
VALVETAYATFGPGPEATVWFTWDDVTLLVHQIRAENTSPTKRLVVTVTAPVQWTETLQPSTAQTWELTPPQRFLAAELDWSAQYGA